MDKNKDKNLYKRVAVAYYKISKSLFFATRVNKFRDSKKEEYRNKE